MKRKEKIVKIVMDWGRSMKSNITNRQMFFLLFMVITTSTTIDLPKVAAQSSGRSAWIPVLATSLFYGLGIILITKLNNRFRGKVVFEYSKELGGSIFGYIIAIYFVVYFLIIGTYLKLKLAGILQSNFLPKTPPVIFVAMSILLSCYVAYKGITNVARLTELYGILFLITTLILCTLMLINGMPDNVLPLYSPLDAKNFLKTAKEVVFSYGGIEILFIIPFTKSNKKASKAAFFTLLFIGFFFALIVEGTIMILGLNNTMCFNDAFVEAIKIIDIPILERMDLFYLTFGLSSLFCGMILVFLAILEFACKIFPKVKRLLMTILIGVILFTLSVFGLKLQDPDKLFQSFGIYLLLTSSFGIPILLFVLSKIRKRAGDQTC